MVVTCSRLFEASGGRLDDVTPRNDTLFQSSIRNSALALRVPAPVRVPMAMAVAPDGTIYTADLELHRIWKMPAKGAKKPEEFAVINSPRGLTLDPDGNLWVLSTSSKDGQIQKVLPDGKVEPFIKGHPFNLPHNIVRVDDGSFFVTDNYEHCVWKVTPDQTKKKWVEGKPMDRPVGLCRSGNNLLIADPHIRAIFSLNPESKELTVLTSSPAQRIP